MVVYLLVFTFLLLVLIDDTSDKDNNVIIEAFNASVNFTKLYHKRFQYQRSEVVNIWKISEIHLTLSWRRPLS